MDESRTFRHKAYELVCSAKAVDSGKFVSTVVVSKQVWPTRPREIAVRRGSHTTAETAIESAHVQGIEWIQNYG